MKIKFNLPTEPEKSKINKRYAKLKKKIEKCRL